MTESSSVRLLDEFRAKAEALGVVVIRATTLRDAALHLVEWTRSLGVDRVVASDELNERVPVFADLLRAARVQVFRPGTPEEMRDTPLGVSLARLAVAETASMLLAEPSLAERSVSMLSLSHVILCPTSALIASLDNAAVEMRAAALAPGASFSTLITGPSRTADIERVLTVGVQGPGKVCNLFVDEL